MAPRNECNARVAGVHDGAIFQKATSWADAIAIYSLAYEDGTVEAIPVTDRVFDTPYFTIPSPNGRPGTAQVDLPQPGPRNNNIPRPSEIHCPCKLGAHFYVVLRGEEVGVFGTWYISYFPLVSCLIGLSLLLGTKRLFVHIIWQVSTTS